MLDTVQPVASSSTIRPATSTDLAEIGNWPSEFASRNKVYTKANKGMTLHDDPELGTKADRALEAAGIGETIASIAHQKEAIRLGTLETHVARRNGKVVGALQIDKYGTKHGGPLTVDWLATHPDVILGNLQEKGIGTELLTLALKRAAELKAPLSLSSASGARSFYEKFGLKHRGGTEYYLSAQQVADKVTRNK